MRSFHPCWRPRLNGTWTGSCGLASFCGPELFSSGSAMDIVEAVYTLGMNLVLLCFVQQFGTAGIYLCFVQILLQTAISTWVFWKPSDMLLSGRFAARNIYEDIGGPGLQVAFLFIGQVSLLLMYFCALFRAAETPTRNYAYWATSYFAVQMSAFFNRGANSQLGQVWNGSLWLAIVQNVNHVSFSCAAFGGEEMHFRVSRLEMVGRGLAGIVVNNMFREALAFTVPIMLMFLSSPFEFVGSCLALNFIVTLDDMEAKEYKVSPDRSTMDLEVQKSFSDMESQRSRKARTTLPEASSKYSMKDTWSEDSPRTIVPGQLVANAETNAATCEPDAPELGNPSAKSEPEELV
eukprot:TRINITY_DN18500_c0_g1_i1.p1 TRINITY_DN18500_c0_g1~~TRINITY_DN18500_c0_g1_i1.p1  ORF type:complete len:349 (-),score=50.95 TRINITY_DN18500_c0_g1_i1:278-1324(-)